MSYIMRPPNASELFVARLLREEGKDPTEFDLYGLTESLASLCVDRDLSNLSQVDQEWLDHTIAQFARV